MVAIRSRSFSILNGSLADGTISETPKASAAFSFQYPQRIVSRWNEAGAQLEASTNENFQYPQRIVSRWNLAAGIFGQECARTLSVSSTDR